MCKLSQSSVLHLYSPGCNSTSQSLWSVFFFCGGKKSYKIKHMQSNELFAMPVFSLAHVSAVHSCICMTLSVRINVHR